VSIGQVAAFVEANPRRHPARGRANRTIPLIRHRVSHRLPTAALLAGGIASVDSPWKTLIGKGPCGSASNPPGYDRPFPATLVHQPISAYASDACGSPSSWN